MNRKKITRSAIVLAALLSGAPAMAADTFWGGFGRGLGDAVQGRQYQQSEQQRWDQQHQLEEQQRQQRWDQLGRDMQEQRRHQELLEQLKGRN